MLFSVTSYLLFGFYDTLYALRLASLIFHFFQKQSVGGCGGSCLFSVSGINDPLKVFRSNLSLPYLDQRPHDGSHHLFQKTIGLDFKTKKAVTALLPFRPSHFSNWGPFW